jgi:hypothetical protein
MIASLRLVLAALVAAFVGISAARAQQPPPTLPQTEVELKALKEHLRLLEQLRARDAKKAANLAAEQAEAEAKALEARLRRLLEEFREQEAKRPITPERHSAQPAPGTPAPGQSNRGGWMVIPAQPQMDPLGLLHNLAKNTDPKIAALARELLERLAKTPAPGSTPLAVKPPTAGKPIELEVELVPDGSRPGLPVVVKPPTRVVVKDEGPKASSTLKMSADGKTAAVVSADGTIVVYDVATGRELMRFGK